MGLEDNGNFPLQRFRDKGLPDITFFDVLPFLERRARDREIFAVFPDLNEKKLLKARAYYHAKIAPKARKRPMRALCDENVSKRHVLSCQRHFSFASSIAIEDMNGQDDRAVWEYACREGYDVIVTHDQRRREMRDLTKIAVCAWHEALSRRNEGADTPALPMLLHLTGKATVPKKFGKILKKNLLVIFTHGASMNVPVLRLNEAGVHVEIGIEDILSVAEAKPASRQDFTRQEQWARYYLGRALPQHKWYDRESPDVLRVKAMITRAVSAAHRVPRERRLTHRRHHAA